MYSVSYAAHLTSKIRESPATVRRHEVVELSRSILQVQVLTGRAVNLFSEGKSFLGV